MTKEEVSSEKGEWPNGWRQRRIHAIKLVSGMECSERFLGRLHYMESLSDESLDYTCVFFRKATSNILNFKE